MLYILVNFKSYKNEKRQEYVSQKISKVKFLKKNKSALKSMKFLALRLKNFLHAQIQLSMKLQLLIKQ